MPSDIQPTTLLFGTNGNDRLSATAGNAAIGLAGNDTLSSSGTLAVLHGGEGDDHYQTDAWVTEIVDSGGNDDSLHLSGHANDYVGGFIEGGHLLLYNTWTGDSVLVMDWRGAGRIEHFQDDYGNYRSAAQVENEINTSGLGEISYREIAVELGLADMNEGDIRALFELDIRFGQMDWENVFRELATADLTDSPRVVAAIRDEVFGDLSPAAQALWQEMGYDQALETSQAYGFAENVATFNRPVAESVALLYAASLDRQPEAEGYNYWLDQAFDGMAMHEMAGYFLESNEFQSRFNVASDDAYIERLYLNVLEREPDGQGQAYWQTAMDEGLPRNEVLMYFATSKENRDNADWLAGLTRQVDGDWEILA